MAISPSSLAFPSRGAFAASPPKPVVMPPYIANLPWVDYKVGVDYNGSSPQTSSVGGLLNGFNPWIGGVQATPSVEDVKRLKPRLWRLGEDQLDPDWYNTRIRVSGAKPEFVLSDSFPYPLNLENPSEWKRPQGPEFQAKVQALYAKYNNHVAYWDVWNEPDVHGFWGDTYGNFIKTFMEAYGAIRSVDSGKAKIGGPSLGDYDKDKLVEFLDACVDHHVQLDFLSWHELWENERQNDFSLIESHILEMRDLLKQPKYRALNCHEIHVNEMVGLASTEKPGNMIAAYYYAELGGAKRPDDDITLNGARATWPNQSDQNEPRSYNNTLGGLLKPGGQKKAPYYAELAYAEVTPFPQVNRPLVTPAQPLSAKAWNANPSNIVVMAGPDRQRKEILVAYGDVSEREYADARDAGSPDNPHGRPVYPVSKNQTQTILLTVADPAFRQGEMKAVAESHILNTKRSADDSPEPYNPFTEYKYVNIHANGQMAIRLKDVQPGELRKVVVL